MNVWERALLNELPFFRRRLDPKTGSAAQEDAARRIRGRMERAVKSSLGTQRDPGQRIAVGLLPQLSDAVGRIPDNSRREKVTKAFEELMSLAQMVRPVGHPGRKGEGTWHAARLVVEAMTDAELEQYVLKSAQNLVDLRDADQAAKMLRPIARAIAARSKGGGRGKSSGEKGPGKVSPAARPRSGEPETAAAGGASAEPVQAAPEPRLRVVEPEPKKTPGTTTPAHAVARGYGATGKGGDQRQVRDALLRPLKLQGKNLEFLYGDLNRGLAKSANVLAAHLADHPASSPEKVRRFQKAWERFVGMVSDYLPKKGERGFGAKEKGR